MDIEIKLSDIPLGAKGKAEVVVYGGDGKVIKQLFLTTVNPELETKVDPDGRVEVRRFIVQPVIDEDQNAAIPPPAGAELKDENKEK